MGTDPKFLASLLRATNSQENQPGGSMDGTGLVDLQTEESICPVLHPAILGLYRVTRRLLLAFSRGLEFRDCLTEDLRSNRTDKRATGQKGSTAYALSNNGKDVAARRSEMHWKL